MYHMLLRPTISPVTVRQNGARKAVVHIADVADWDGARRVMGELRERYPRMRLLSADRSCHGALKDWMKERLGWALEIVKVPRREVTGVGGRGAPPYPKGFIVLPRRWAVERTIAWICWNRRMSRDHEFLPRPGRR